MRKICILILSFVLTAGLLSACRTQPNGTTDPATTGPMVTTPIPMDTQATTEHTTPSTEQTTPSTNGTDTTDQIGDVTTGTGDTGMTEGNPESRSRPRQHY